MASHGAFTRIQLTNWRNFRHVDVELGDRVFVVGPNAAGKSNFLDAFRFLHDLAVEGGGLTNALEKSGRGGFKAVRSLHARKENHVGIAVHVELDGDHWTYELELEALDARGKKGAARVRAERVTKGKKIVLSRPASGDDSDPELLLSTALETSAANKTFRALRDFFRSVDFVHVVPQLVRTPAKDDAARFSAGYGYGLVAAMGDLGKRERTARLKRIETGLKAVLPQFESLEWIQDKRGVPHLRAKYRHWRKTGAWQEESTFSDGTLRLIGLLWTLTEPGGPLLLEEPELSLHAAAVRTLPSLFAGIQVKSPRQFIVSTHASELLADKGIDPAEVVVLRSLESETTATVGSRFESMVDAARDDASLAPLIEALTGPAAVAQLALFGDKA